jgi:5,10-methenyltetrahydrofolate synthetase
MLKNNADLIRISLRAERAGMCAAARDEQSQKLCTQLTQWLPGLNDQETQPLIIAAYWPLTDEPDITPILYALVRVGHTVVLPVVAQRSAPLEFHRWSPGASMRTGNFGVMEPARTQALQPDLLLVPTLGYTGQGDRLGYGGGYYDRTLAAMQKNNRHTPLAVGIAWSEGLLTNKYPAYQPQIHDMPLHAVLSAQGWSPSKPDTPVPLSV